jgi:hypothetical protein
MRPTAFVALFALLACSQLVAAQFVDIGQKYNLMSSGTTSYVVPTI